MPKGTGRPNTRPNRIASMAPGDRDTQAKLRTFQASTVANRRGSAAQADGSIIRRSNALNSDSDNSGIARSNYGMSTRSGTKGSSHEYGVRNRPARANAGASVKPNGKARK
jgi:hypothetical protein